MQNLKQIALYLIAERLSTSVDIAAYLQLYNLTVTQTKTFK